MYCFVHQHSIEGRPEDLRLTGMANLASTYCLQGRWNEAEEQLEFQAMGARKFLGADKTSK